MSKTRNVNIQDAKDWLKRLKGEILNGGPVRWSPRWDRYFDLMMELAEDAKAPRRLPAADPKIVNFGEGVRP